jgi:hypothetical protein
MADVFSIATIVVYFLLGSYSIFLHKIYGYTYSIGAMMVAGMGLTVIDLGKYEEWFKMGARIIIFYSIWKLIQRRGDEKNHYDKEK